MNSRGVRLVEEEVVGEVISSAGHKVVAGDARLESKEVVSARQPDMRPVREHIPLRSCVVCGNKLPKRQMIRLVAVPRGSVRVDSTGKMQGRGGYICKERDCSDVGLRKGRIEHSFRRTMSNGEWIELESSIEHVFSRNGDSKKW